MTTHILSALRSSNHGRIWIAGASVLVAGLLTACDRPIIHDLSELEANRVVVLLARRSIDAKKVRDGGGWSVAVSGSDASEALLALDSSRVFSKNAEDLRSSSKSFVQTREEKLHGVERRIAFSLEQTLERIPGVLEARVHLSLPPPPSFEPRRVSGFEEASVLVVAAPENQIDDSQIRALVSGASGVSREQISVVRTISLSEVKPLDDVSFEAFGETLGRAHLEPPESGSWQSGTHSWSPVSLFQDRSLVQGGVFLVPILLALLVLVRSRRRGSRAETVDSSALAPLSLKTSDLEVREQ